LAPELAVHYGDPKTGLVLEDRLGGLRQNAAGERARLVLESSDLVKNRKYRHHVLLRHWVSHLAGNLALHQADADSPGMQTLVIAKVGSVTLPPLDKPRAEDLLAGLLDAWWQGQTRPLPLAVKTAFAWLDDQVSQRDTAPQVYEGGYNMEGELGGSPYLQRAWPSYAALLADGDFGRWAKALLQPLMNAVLHKEAA
jgi:exodeoxyribonuclease V gamma subunit